MDLTASRHACVNVTQHLQSESQACTSVYPANFRTERAEINTGSCNNTIKLKLGAAALTMIRGHEKVSGAAHWASEET